MFNLEKFVRPNIQSLKPYHSARDDYEQGLLLDANENSQGAPAKNLNGLHRYPSPKQQKLRKKIASFRSVEPENVFVGNGSDEAIDLLYRIFCRPGNDRVIITPPTYGMYSVSANIHDVGVDKVLLHNNFQPQVDEILTQSGDHTKLLFLCSPNNPTGNLLNREKIERLVDEFPGIVVIDEAYIDFSKQESYASKVRNYPNLVVLQTMSKSFGLAGIRLGTAFASAEIIDYFMKVKAPYNINALTAKAALDAFDHLDIIKEKIQQIKKERNRLYNMLGEFTFVRHIYSSETNFLLVKMDRAKEIYQQLAGQNIIVRYRGNEPGCDGCLRITVGTSDENNTLLNALKNVSL
ncbi:MAG: histidinol-phosphate transaminase [Balneolaceae bacterium]|nr:histidinol-phosphate transaminase [Balneolaceae bacterium]